MVKVCLTIAIFFGICDRGQYILIFSHWKTLDLVSSCSSQISKQNLHSEFYLANGTHGDLTSTFPKHFNMHASLKCLAHKNVLTPGFRQQLIIVSSWSKPVWLLSSDILKISESQHNFRFMNWRHFSKYVALCSTEKKIKSYMFGILWGQVNDYIFIFEWTITLQQPH